MWSESSFKQGVTADSLQLKKYLFFLLKLMPVSKLVYNFVRQIWIPKVRRQRFNTGSAVCRDFVEASEVVTTYNLTLYERETDLI